MSETIIVLEKDVSYITVREFLEALEKNGYKHARHSFIKETKSFLGYIKEIAACPIGQAALNLNVYPLALKNALNNFRYAGDTIIRWNDLPSEVNGEPRYLTYGEIVTKVRELLEPYLDRKIPVIRRDANKDWISRVYVKDYPLDLWGALKDD